MGDINGKIISFFKKAIAFFTDGSDLNSRLMNIHGKLAKLESLYLVIYILVFLFSMRFLSKALKAADNKSQGLVAFAKVFTFVFVTAIVILFLTSILPESHFGLFLKDLTTKHPKFISATFIGYFVCLLAAWAGAMLGKIGNKSQRDK